MGAMQKAIDQLVAQGALKKVTKPSDFMGAIKDPKKIPDFAGPAVMTPGLTSKAKPTKTTRRSTIMTSAQGLQADADIKRKKLYLGSET